MGPFGRPVPCVEAPRMSPSPGEGNRSASDQLFTVWAWFCRWPWTWALTGPVAFVATLEAAPGGVPFGDQETLHPLGQAPPVHSNKPYPQTSSSLVGSKNMFSGGTAKTLLPLATRRLLKVFQLFFKF
uniref:Uncharacterized protein n=1 Tax=Molossus molossus TaxID=27622 RepID=A0A7J8FRM5_MOLMO|nr:hypothetical protein HJG59_008317 [Molossus molossus]